MPLAEHPDDRVIHLLVTLGPHVSFPPFALKVSIYRGQGSSRSGRKYLDMGQLDNVAASSTTAREDVGLAAQ